MANALSLKLTDAGMALLINACAGQGFEFQRIAFGNGDGSSATDSISALVNEVASIGIEKIERSGNYGILSGTYDNSAATAAQTGFYMKEVGLYGRTVLTVDDEGNKTYGEEQLYAYRYADENVQYIPELASGCIVAMTFGVVVAVGTTENITAKLSESAAYVSTDTFSAHVSDKTNPHSVTKSQVGLGNVENLAFKNQLIEIDTGQATANIVAGETTKSTFGKIYKVLASYLRHIVATNPHEITPTMIGAASTAHTHSATDVTSGVLSVERGGTGQTSYPALANALWAYLNVLSGDSCTTVFDDDKNTVTETYDNGTVCTIVFGDSTVTETATYGNYTLTRVTVFGDSTVTETVTKNW